MNNGWPSTVSVIGGLSVFPHIMREQLGRHIFPGNLEEQPWLGLVIILALGGIFFFLVARAARSIGTEAAIQRLQKWTQLPTSILGLVSAPNYRAALQGVANTLANALNVHGVLVVLAEPNDHQINDSLELLSSNGTLQGKSDADMLEAVMSVDHFKSYLSNSEKAKSLVIASSNQTSHQFRQVFTRLHKKGQLVGLGLRLHGRHQAESSTLCLMLFDLGQQKPLDRFEREAMQATITQFPRVAESLSGRLAQAELSERLLDESRRRDEILQQMLNGFQHDVANALRNIEQSIEAAQGILQDQNSVDGPNGAESAFADVRESVKLAGQVAYSASMLPEIARGDTPIVEPRAHDPALLFSRLLQPLISVKAGTRKDLVVNYEVAPELPQIMVDEVPFFRAMSNVIGNAFKFTEQGGINILVYKDEPHVAFAVSDTGVGMPTEEMGSVGKLRFRASNVVDISGSGIGLWTATRLVEAMGGIIKIDSKLGRGSTVTLLFLIAPH